MGALTAWLTTLDKVTDGFGGDRFATHEQLVPGFVDLCLQGVKIGVQCLGFAFGRYGGASWRRLGSNGAAGFGIPFCRVPGSMNRHLFHYSINCNTEINRPVNFGVTMMLFEVEKQTKTLRDHTQMLLNW